MQNYAAQAANLNKGFMKAGDLQRQLAALRKDQPEVRPMDAAHALLPWFQEPDNEHIRLDVLYYAISHAWGIVTSKIEDSVPAARPASGRQVKQAIQQNRAKRAASVSATALAANEALEQMFATLRNMTFKQARMLHGATAKLDLGKGSDDQRLCDVFSDDDIRSALK